MALDEMHYFTLLEVGRKIQGGEISSVELTEAMLARIERLNPALHPYVTILAESALAEAAQADSEVARGEGRGPMHGVPIAVKDLMAITGTASVRMAVEHELSTSNFKLLVLSEENFCFSKSRNKNHRQ